MAEYVAVLHKLAKHYNFGEALDEMLPDRLVYDITKLIVQKHLLAETEVRFTKAMTIAQAMELAEKGSKDLNCPLLQTSKDIHKFLHATNSKNPSH